MPWLRRAFGLVAVWAAVAGCAPGPRDGGGPDDPVHTACQPNKQIDCTCADGTTGKATCSADGARLGVCACGGTTLCEAGTSQACSCAGGVTGTQQCASDGSAWGACECRSDRVCEPQSVASCTCENGASGQQTCALDGLSWGACLCSSGCTSTQMSATGSVRIGTSTIDFTGAQVQVNAAHVAGVGCVRAVQASLSRANGTCPLRLTFTEMSPGFGGLSETSFVVDATCPGASSSVRGEYKTMAGYGLVWPTLQPEAVQGDSVVCVPQMRIGFPQRQIPLVRTDGARLDLDLSRLVLQGKLVVQSDGGNTCPSASVCTGGYDEANGWCSPRQQGCTGSTHDGGDGRCVPLGQCSSGFHDDGTGTCVDAPGACAVGYHDGGDGRCVVQNSCSPGYTLVPGFGLCVALGDQCTQAPAVANAGIDQQVAPGTTVTLDGSGSSSPRSGSLAYTWRVVGKPSGAVSPTLSGSGARRTFVPQTVGDYVFELTVNDGTCTSPADSVVVHVGTAPVRHTVSVQLTWTGGQAGGEGSDLDLHYLGPKGTFYDFFSRDLFGQPSNGSDACWGNKNPDWGLNNGTTADSIRTNDPNLTADALWGPGLESLTHQNIFDGEFTVVVHNWCSRQASASSGSYGASTGPATATVTVFVDGVQRFQSYPPRVVPQRTVWKAARISVVGGQVSVAALNELDTLSYWNASNPNDQANQSCTGHTN